MPKKVTKKHDDSSSEEQTKKKRKRKDPNAPKRPANPYLLFSQDHREEAKKQNPDLKGVALTPILSEMWKNADEETKQKYKDKQAELNEKYKEELEEYKANKGSDSDEDEEPEKKKKKKKAKKDPNAPKRALSSYMIFCAENREEAKANNPDKKLTELSKVLGDQWKSLSDKEKKVYQDKAEEAKAAYAIEKKAYDAKKEKEVSSSDEDSD